MVPVKNRPFGRTHGVRRFLHAALVASFALVNQVSVAQLIEPPSTDRDDDASRGFNPVFVLDPIAESGIGVHVNMPVVRNEPNGWSEFRRIIERCRASGLFIILNNLSGPRNGAHLTAETFESWNYNELVRFASALAGTRVPVLLYVGPIEHDGDTVAVPVERFETWRQNLAWITQITGAPAGVVVDGSALFIPGGAPDGSTRFEWFSLFAEAVAPLNMEVGFEAFRRHPNGTPYEDRRHYALLHYIVARYATLPETADADARIMSAIDALPAAVNPRRNTVWLENDAWNELLDLDPVPQDWLDAWGSTPESLAQDVVNRLYLKGYALILPSNVLGE